MARASRLIQKRTRQSEPGGLSELLASPALARLVLHFALHAEDPVHMRALQRHCRLSMSSVTRELKRLESRGLVQRMEHGGRVLYRIEAHRGWKTLRRLIRDFADPAEVVAAAIAGVEGIQVAFVFGSFARRDAREDSDVDVLVVGDIAPDSRLGHLAAEASMLLGRDVEIRTYRPEKLARQVDAGNAVLRRILDGPKRWIVGDEAVLAEVAG
jgi:predicted nucleotidyltransferase